MQEVVYLLKLQFALSRSAETAYAPNTNGWFVPGQKFVRLQYTNPVRYDVV
jgi:hypothetical protein